MAASELFSRGNEAFVDEHFEEAVKHYTDAIELDSCVQDYFINRARAYIKLKKYEEALRDADRAISLNPDEINAHERRGTALYHKGEYILARESFIKGQTLDPCDHSIQEWISKCELKISGIISDNKNGKSVTFVPEIPMPIGAKTRHDWYQTETHVIVTVLIKNAKQDEVAVNFQEKSLSLTVQMSDSSDYSLELDLQHHIVPSQCITKVLKSKIEIKMKKEEGIRWSSLEGEFDPTIKDFKQETAQAIPADTMAYPSSSQHTKNWDKVAKEIAEEEKNEKPEGDAALNALFQQIYADGSDEVKKAMNKSFSESGGTVLSTNWKDIGKAKTDIKPPDGMEWKKYEQS